MRTMLPLFNSVRPIGRLFNSVRPIGRLFNSVRPIGRLLTWGVVSIYRVFPRVILRVRVILDSAAAVHPPSSLGGLWGGRSPALNGAGHASGVNRMTVSSAGLRGSGGYSPGSYNVFYGDSWSLYSPPPVRGGWGGSAQVLT